MQLAAAAIELSTAVALLLACVQAGACESVAVD
jgi:hypothetical protein